MRYIADTKQQINARQFLANQAHSAQCFSRTIYIGTYCEHQTIQINILSLYAVMLTGSYNTLGNFQPTFRFRWDAVFV